MQRRNILNVECCVKATPSSPSNANSISQNRSSGPGQPSPNIQDEVEQWLRDHYDVLEINHCLSPPGVQFVNVVDLVQKKDEPNAHTCISLADVNLRVHVFRLHHEPATNLESTRISQDPDSNIDGVPAETEQLQARVTLLPHHELQCLWESRLVLLYGPPGTGKTTLCRALAQKLAIRLRGQYSRTKLIEIDAAAMFSKFFGESSKLVSNMFRKIESMLDEEPNVFLSIFVDEIESLAGVRQHSAGANEPKDSMRDPAFLDRIDVKQYVPGPSIRMRYEIFRRCYLDLLACNVVTSVSREINNEGMDPEESTDRSLESWQVIDRASVHTNEILPTYESMEGLSGRVLQRLPTQALAMHIRFDPCSIEEALDALARMVDEQELSLEFKKNPRICTSNQIPKTDTAAHRSDNGEDNPPSFVKHRADTFQASFNPTQIFADDVTEEKGENARLSAFVGAIAVGDLVKSTLGPKGMDKILQSASTGEIMVTNDGATILKSIALDNAAAKVLVNISKVQDDEVGDGTTSVAVLAAELLREAEKLVERKIHPQTIIEGYRIASNVALEALAKTAQNHSKDKDLFRKDLLAIARTTLSSKVLSQDRDHFAALACDAVLRMQGSTDLSHIQIIKKAGGKLSDSYLDEGFILDKRIGVNQPKRLEKAKILVANTAMDTDKVKIFGARVKVDSAGGLAKLEEAEREKMKQKVEKIKAHGINCFVNRQLIYNRPEQLFSDAGIVSIEHADFDGIERLALVTGGEIASTFDHPEMVKLGHCDLIEEVIIGEDTLIKFSGVAAGQACTIVLRGATEQLLDEAERSLHDALAVLSQTVREPKTTLGGGCAEMVMAKAVEQEAPNVAGKKALAVDAFAAALQQLPTILADNAGFDSSDLVTRLKKEIYKGQTSSGLDLLIPGGGIADMREKGVIESYKLKRAVVSSASEAAELLLRVDSIVRCAPRRRERM
ncbi:MAG: hypothetical protein Q9184_004731 [Pyrenodesmia sp. 2 TL-2023]